MDVNNYSYVNMNGKTQIINRFEDSDDMEASLSRQVNYFGEECFVVVAMSYDGQLDLYEEFDELDKAKALYEYLVNECSSTVPDEEMLNKLIN